MATVFESDDMDAFHDLLNQLYGRMRLTVTGGPQRVRLTREAIGAVELHETAFSVRFGVEAPALGSVVVGHVRGGTVTYPDRQYRAGDAFLVAQPDEPYRVAVDALESEFAIITSELLNQTANTAPGRRAEPIRFTGYEPTTANATAIWDQAYEFARRSAPAALEQPLLADSIGRLLAAAALETVPNNALHDPTIEDRRDAHPYTVRRAVSFIDENAHRDIGVGDIAASAHVTIRAIQLAFRRHLGTTPLSYLRRVRMEHAHRDLLAAEPGSTTVNAIAARWGFPDHSRFSANYHAVYGHPPSTSLRTR